MPLLLVFYVCSFNSFPTFYSRWVHDPSVPHLHSTRQLSRPLETQHWYLAKKVYLLAVSLESLISSIPGLLHEVPNLCRLPLLEFLQLRYLYSLVPEPAVMPSRLLLRDADLLKYRITELAGSLENIHFTDEETATPNHTVSLKWSRLLLESGTGLSMLLCCWSSVGFLID